MSQTSLWQANQQNNDFAELCNALYERELRVLANLETTSVESVQGRLKSLSYYINRTANLMAQVCEQGKSPLDLDTQNATWSAKQASKLPLAGQTEQDILSWYEINALQLGLVIPVLKLDHITLDSIDRIDPDKNRVRTNASGWFSLEDVTSNSNHLTLLKPNKKVMMAACAGHCWQDNTQKNKLRPTMLSLRELLLSCAINWQDFKHPLAL